MKLQISLSSLPIVAETIVMLMNMRTSTHLLHLTEGNDAAHRALGEFYDQVVDIADRFAECAIATYGKVRWPENLSDGLTVSLSPAEYLRTCKASILVVAPTFADQKDLDNIMSELVELCSQTIFKLEQLH